MLKPSATIASTLVIQVGGGALGSAVVSGLQRELGETAMPVINAVQPEQPSTRRRLEPARCGTRRSCPHHQRRASDRRRSTRSGAGRTPASEPLAATPIAICALAHRAGVVRHGHSRRLPTTGCRSSMRPPPAASRSSQPTTTSAPIDSAIPTPPSGARRVLPVSAGSSPFSGMSPPTSPANASPSFSAVTSVPEIRFRAEMSSAGSVNV